MSKGLEALEIARQRLNTIRENTKIGNRRIADEENEACIKGIETCLSDIEKSLNEGEETKRIAKSYKELVFTLIEELNIEFELSTDGYRDEDGQIDIDYYVSLNGDRKKVGLTKVQYELFRKWEEN